MKLDRALCRMGLTLAMVPATALMLTGAARAQTVSPIIVEYQEKGEGKILLSNTTLAPLIVQIEAQSFSIAPDGTAIYRPLDAGIHVDLSTNSVRLAPNQTYYVFYKTRADHLPAWYTIYASFSNVKHGEGLNMRIMLPHTVYLLQKQPLQKTQVRVSDARYLPDKKQVVFDIANTGQAFGRMREGSVQAQHDSAMISGFPLLPGSPRHLEVPWTSNKEPQSFTLHFDHFEIKTMLGPSPPGQGLGDK